MGRLSTSKANNGATLYVSTVNYQIFSEIQVLKIKVKCDINHNLD